MKKYDGAKSRDEFNRMKNLVRDTFDSRIPEYMEYGKEDMLYCIEQEIDYLERFRTMFENLKNEVEGQVEES